LTNISQEVVDTLVAKEVQQPLYQLIDNMRNHLTEIKDYIEDNQLNELHKFDTKMQKIIITVKGLNSGSSNYLFDSKEKIITLKTIQDSNALIEELLSQKQ